MTEDTTRHPIVVKIALIGETGVGKTCIINRYIKNTFSDEQMSTTGAVFSTRLISYIDEKITVRQEIWDTAGQERYRSLAKVIYKNATIIVLVYDITSRDSFEEIKNFWISEVQSNSKPNTIFGLAANKNDLYAEEEVTVQEGEELAKKINAIFQATSAKNGNGIDKLFERLGKRLINPDNEDFSLLTPEQVEERINDIEAMMKGEAPTRKIKKNDKNKGGCC